MCWLRYLCRSQGNSFDLTFDELLCWWDRIDESWEDGSLLQDVLQWFRLVMFCRQVGQWSIHGRFVLRWVPNTTLNFLYLLRVWDQIATSLENRTAESSVCDCPKRSNQTSLDHDCFSLKLIIIFPLIKTGIYFNEEPKRWKGSRSATVLGLTESYSVC